MADLNEKFNTAVEAAKNIPKATNDDLLELYKYYKQVSK